MAVLIERNWISRDSDDIVRAAYKTKPLNCDAYFHRVRN